MQLSNENMTRDYIQYECIINGQLESAWSFGYEIIAPSTALYRRVYL